jgi:hypothetical protein
MRQLRAFGDQRLDGSVDAVDARAHVGQVHRRLRRIILLAHRCVSA